MIVGLNMSLKIVNCRLQPHLSGGNELGKEMKVAMAPGPFIS